jgi:hypothetical protein
LALLLFLLTLLLIFIYKKYFFNETNNILNIRNIHIKEK